ncbi:MAG TPA: hypothetical protein VFJ98_03515 [Mycobacteriales bacterium]|nr:hypothetical protein [Mycobacteriales bacterium]
MTLPTRATAHLVVLGLALVVAAAHPANDGTAPAAAQPAAGALALLHLRAVTFATSASYLPRTRTAPHRPPRHRRARHRHRHLPSHRHLRPRRQVPQRHHHDARPAPATTTRITGWRDLDAAIARIPSYRRGVVRWLVDGRYGHWGTDDWYHARIYIAPTVPTGYLYDVAVHEWSHELSVLDYDGNVAAATHAMNSWFGGSGLTGAERAADCMAILQGADWTHYTSCTDSHWRAGAARLVRGGRL